MFQTFLNKINTARAKSYPTDPESTGNEGISGTFSMQICGICRRNMTKRIVIVYQLGNRSSVSGKVHIDKLQPFSAKCCQNVSFCTL